MNEFVITTRYGSRTAAGGGGGVSGGGGAGGGVDNFSKYFEVVNEGTAEELIKAKFPLHSINDIVAFSNGTGGGTAPTIPLATYATVGVVKVDPNTMTVDAAGMIAVKGDLFNLSNYYDKSASDGRFAAIAHSHNFSDLGSKPTTLGGYGITDAMTASQINTAIAQAKADIVNSSPAALDTLNELATALGNDPNFATTTATALGNRLRVDISTQGLTDVQRANGRANLGLGSAALLSGDLVFKAKLGCLDLNNCTEEGTYYWVPDTPHIPATGYGTIITIDGYGGWFNQLALGTDKYTLAWRSSINNNTTWCEWIDIYHAGNLNNRNSDFTAKDVFALSTKFRGPDGNVKWTAQMSAAGDYLEFYNASGVLEMRLSQAGKLQVRDDVEAFSNFN